MDFGTSLSSSVLAASAIFLIGVVAGVCGGYWGVGAGWMVSPCLLLLGVSGKAVVACSIIHMAVKSIAPTAMRWRSLKGQEAPSMWTIGAPMLLAAAATVGLGSWLVTRLGMGRVGEISGADVFVTVGYCVIMFLIALQCLWGHFRLRNGEGVASAAPRRPVRDVSMSAVTGGLSGLLGGALGVGGGILRRPILQHVLRLPEAGTAGISQLTLLVASGVGTGFHAQAGNVIWPTAAALSLGGIVGQILGTVVSHRAMAAGQHHWANLTFGLAVAGILVASLIKLAALWRPGLERVGQVWILILGAGMCVLVLWGALLEKEGGAADAT